MLNSQTLYPAFAVNQLRCQYGQRWAELVDWISTLPHRHPSAIAFTLTVRRLGRMIERRGHSDASCAVCISHIVADFKGSEQELLDLFYRNLDEVTATLDTMQRRKTTRQQQASVA